MKTTEFVESLIPHLDLRAKTKKNYLGAYRKNLAPAIGDKELVDVTKAEIMASLDVLPAQTRYQTLMMARRVFSEAEERGLIPESPARSIKAPKISVKNQGFLTWEELEKIDFGKQTKRIRFLALHGLRFGEAAALTKDDIKGDFIHITKSKHGLTKSKAGNRIVPLACDFVTFANNQKSIARALKPYGVTVHSLRKTYAYILKRSGVHVTTASRLMGHSNTSITLNIYTKVRDDEIEQSGAEIREYIRKAS
jgi:integrase